MALAAACLAGCGTDDEAVHSPAAEASPFAGARSINGNDAPSSVAEQAADPSACSEFVDAADEVGIAHVYHNGMRGENLMTEATGGGCGWLDYDGDGNWDLYLNQGGDAATDDLAAQPNDQLLRNYGGRLFAPVTAAARIVELRYGQGVAISDYDADGFDDIYVTNVGRNTLYRNCGDGTFQDATDSSGTGDTRWSSSAAWSDLDGDGLVDLYVCNYCDYDPRQPIPCIRDGMPRICHPKDIPPIADEFYRNRGDGQFTAEAAERGLFGPQNRGLGVVTADFDDDGDVDVFVANDTTANFLFENDGRGRFQEVGSLRGCAVDRNGATQASMGVACGDFDNDGLLDLYSTHFYRESNTLYRNLGKIGFEDVTGSTGLHEPTMPMLGFGTVMADFNRDTRQELFVANGHIDPDKPKEGHPYAMPAQLFAYGGARWRDCSLAAGEYFAKELVGRGVASCDYDNDGDVDLCVVHQNSPAALLENRATSGHWLQVKLIGTRGDRRSSGARVVVHSGSAAQMQEMCGGTSYVSSHQPVLAFGLGNEGSPCAVEIRWPGGASERIENVRVDQVLVRHEP